MAVQKSAGMGAVDKLMEGLAENIETLVKNTLTSLGVATRDDLKQVEKRLSRVEEKMATAKKPAAKKAAAKKAATKKPACRKPAAKKAATKKPSKK
ncbi:MAG: hypothetical protein PHO53_03245 [Actinomycetota bacterium]|nr:hypothetical protein [Actinomycetota bacterium]